MDLRINRPFGSQAALFGLAMNSFQIDYKAMARHLVFAGGLALSTVTAHSCGLGEP